MEEELKIIEQINKKERITKEDLDILEKLNKKKGTYYLENNIITIEYHSPLEKFKAKQILSIFAQNEKFYQTFLMGKEKIVFSNEKINNSNIITIDSFYFETKINEDIFLRKIFEDVEKKGIDITTDIKDKLNGKKTLVTKEDKMKLLKQKLLNGIKKQGQIDFFDYLDLTGGFVNEHLYIRKLAIDLAFNQGHYSILKRILKDDEDEEINDIVYHLLYEECALDLLNDQLDFQNKKINQEGKRNFLKENLMPISQLFANEILEVIKKYKQVEIKKEKVLTREEILKETAEILKDIDPSNNLLKAFEENISNGKIILWDSKDTEKRKQMYQKYHKDFNIDEAGCIRTIENNKIKDYIVNIPLNYTVDDIPTIIHEMMHLNSILKNKEEQKSEDLAEFASIYFEEYTKNRLMEKGYTKEELYSSKNERIINTIELYQIASPTIFWLNQYRIKGKLTFGDIDQLVRKQWHYIVKLCQEKKYTKEQTNTFLQNVGLVPNIDACTNHVIEELAKVLVTYNTSIFKRYKYILGTILTNYAIENNIDKELILNISNNLNSIEDPGDVLKGLGINMEEYGLERIKEESTKHLKK